MGQLGWLWYEADDAKEPIVLFSLDTDWLIPNVNTGYPAAARAFIERILAKSLVTGGVVYSPPPGDSRIFRRITQQTLLIAAIEALGFSITYTNIATAEGYIILPLFNPDQVLTTAERDNIRNQGRRYGAFLMGEHSGWNPINNQTISIFKAGWGVSGEVPVNLMTSTGRYKTVSGPIAEVPSPQTSVGWFVSGPSVSGPETLAYVSVNGVQRPAMVDLNFDRIAPADLE